MAEALDAKDDQDAIRQAQVLKQDARSAKFGKVAPGRAARRSGLGCLIRGGVLAVDLIGFRVQFIGNVVEFAARNLVPRVPREGVAVSGTATEVFRLHRRYLPAVRSHFAIRFNRSSHRLI
ncbi:MAG: hypothetical protein ACJ8FS_09065 [Sphingomicrobium sp.]